MDRIINLSRRADFRSRAVYINVWGDSLRTQNPWRAAYDGRDDVFGLVFLNQLLISRVKIKEFDMKTSGQAKSLKSSRPEKLRWPK